MFSKPCPGCGVSTFAPIFWLPQNWLGTACRQCGAQIKLERTQMGLASVLIVPLVVLISSNGVPNSYKLAATALALLVGGYLDLSKRIVVKPPKV